jgi:hypothetical protein
VSEVLRLRQDRVDWRRVSDGIIARDLETAEEFTVNASGASLWGPLCSGSGVDELVAALIEIYDIDRHQALRDVEAFCALLAARGLLDDGTS